MEHLSVCVMTAIDMHEMTFVMINLNNLPRGAYKLPLA